MIYTDRPATAFWGNYVKSGPHRDVAWISGESDEFGQKSRLKKRIVRYMRESENMSLREEDIEWVAVRDWGRDPYGGNHAWRPKRNYGVVMKNLSNLALIEPITTCVHVCGEAYSDYHGFMEGALRSAVFALSTMKLEGGSNLDWLKSSLGIDEGDEHLESLKHWINNLGKINTADVYGLDERRGPEE